MKTKISSCLQMNLFFQNMAKGLSTEQIRQTLLDEENGGARRSKRTAKKRINNSALATHNASEATESINVAIETIASASNSTTESISSTSNSSVLVPANLNIADDVDQIHEILQEPDSETELEFEEYPFDPIWFPDNEDINTGQNNTLSNEVEDALSPDDVSPDISPDAVPALANENINDVEFMPDWKRLEVKNITTEPLTLDKLKDYTRELKVMGIENLSPVEIFSKMFPDEIYELVAIETNRYAKVMIEKLKPLKKNSRFHKWKDVTPAKIKAYIAIEMAMGMVKKPKLELYFHDNFWLTETPGFAQIMNVKEYQLIRYAIHFADNDNADPNDRLYKIRPIMDIVKDLYAKILCPGKELSVDETMVRFQGRVSFKQYNKDKPNKWAIKLWSLAASSIGFLLKYDVYLGAEPGVPKPPGGLGAKVVMKLLEDYKYMGHVVYMDNYYSSIPLYRSLRNMDIGACGTINIRRKCLPPVMKKIKLKQGDLPAIWLHKKELLTCTWQDIGRVNMLTTVGDTGITNTKVKSKTKQPAKSKAKRTEGATPRYIDKPNCNVDYNKFMGGVDVFDQLSQTYKFLRRTNKWYHVIWYFIIQTALVNARIAYIIQNPSESKITAYEFRKQVIVGLLDGHPRRPPEQKRGRKRSLESHITVDSRLNGRHFPSVHKNQNQNPNKRFRPDCAVCSIRPNQCKKGKKGPCKRHQTVYYCEKCIEYNQPALCIENSDGLKCFEIFHTKQKFRETCKCSA